MIFESLLILIGGDETTRHVISGGGWQILNDRDQWGRLVADPSLLTPAIEEMLRWVTPIKNMARVATRDVEIGGETVQEGQKVLLLYPSANRDETVFECPDEFILHRPNIKEHIAFGRGAHYCVGTALARLELRIMLEALVLRTTRIEVSGDIEMSPFPELGPWAVPVKLHTA